MHDFHAFCCSNVLLRGDGALCEPPLCNLSAPWTGVRRRCVRGSLALSGLAVAESFFRNSVLRSVQLVTRYVSPSRFLADQLRRAGLCSRPIDVIANAVPVQPPSIGGSGLLFVGRLSPEKGLDVLLEAAEITGLPLTIAGDGPLMPYLKERANGRVKLLGRVSPSRVSELLSAAAVAVVPSICYENAPLSVLEPMACGTPVVASAIGGIPELVRDGVDGLLVEPGVADFVGRRPQSPHRRQSQSWQDGRRGPRSCRRGVLTGSPHRGADAYVRPRAASRGMRDRHDRPEGHPRHVRGRRAACRGAVGPAC